MDEDRVSLLWYGVARQSEQRCGEDEDRARANWSLRGNHRHHHYSPIHHFAAFNCLGFGIPRPVGAEGLPL